MFDDSPQIVRDFLYYLLTIKGRSPKTVDGYYIDIRNFLKYLKSKKEKILIKKSISEIDIKSVDIDFLSKISLSDVYDYLNYVMSERKNNANTRARKVSSIRALFRYLTLTTHTLNENPIKELDMPTIKKTLPKYLTLEESIELLNSVNTIGSARDNCIIVLFLNCGMRLSELVGINLQDIKENTLKLLGKGNKERIIYLNKSCNDALNAYFEERKSIKPKPGHENALFLSKFASRITPRRVEQIVETYLKSVDLNNKGFSPHKLRHTAATLLYQHAHVDVRVLQELLGHSSLATTQIYTHVSNKQLKDAMSNSPLPSIDKKSKK
ncbi:MAG: tyrosine recombinase XerC [Oscillospiraceae bacterium]